MSYRLSFLPSALKEWRDLDGSLREQFKKKLAERLAAPRIEADKLRGAADRYKIKLRAAGYRLVYVVDDGSVTVLVIAVGRRDRGEVYKEAARR